MPSDLI